MSGLIAQFLLAAAVIIFAGTFLTRAADTIAEETGWGRLIVGVMEPLFHMKRRRFLIEPNAMLILVLGALFREGEDWAVFVAEYGRARLRIVKIGRNDLEAASGFEREHKFGPTFRNKGCNEFAAPELG